MKKFLLLSVALFTCGVLHAEGMQFVTVLSSPLGTFNQLETADPNAATTATRVNFCTARSTEGTIDLHHKDLSIQNIFLRPGTSLVGNDVKNFSSTTSLTLGDGGKVEGKSLVAKELSFFNAGSAKINVTGTLTIDEYALARVGRAETMSLGNGTYTKGSPAENQYPNVNLSWDNKYECEVAYNADGSCPDGKNTKANSYLLKSTESWSCAGSKGASYSENCASGYEGSKTYTWNTEKCIYELTADNCKKKASCSWKSSYQEITMMYCGDTYSDTVAMCRQYGYSTSTASFPSCTEANKGDVIEDQCYVDDMCPGHAPILSYRYSVCSCS